MLEREALLNNRAEVEVLKANEASPSIRVGARAEVDEPELEEKNYGIGADPSPVTARGRVEDLIES